MESAKLQSGAHSLSQEATVRAPAGRSEWGNTGGRVFWTRDVMSQAVNTQIMAVVQMWLAICFV